MVTRDLTMATLGRIVVVTALATRVSAQTIDFEQPGRQTCGTDANVQGYASLDLLRADQQAEFDKIQAGSKEPEVAYIWALCPNTDYDATTPLQAILPNSQYVCGNFGQSSDNCNLVGGDVQVQVDESQLDGVPLGAINIFGLTFNDFTGAAIDGTAGSDTTVTINDAAFVAFQAESLARQQPSGDAAPFNLDVTNSIISDGVASMNLFTNAGGVLRLESLQVSGSGASSLVSTGPGGDGQGVSIVSNVDVSGSQIQDVFVTSGGSNLQATGVTVQNMAGMDNVFSVNGPGSFARLENVQISDNDLSSTMTAFNGVSVIGGASAFVTNSDISRNTNVRRPFNVEGPSELNLQSVDVDDNSGVFDQAALGVSSAIFANAGATVNAERLEIDNADNFVAVYLANAGSSVTVRQSCINSGQSVVGAYASEESSFTAANSFQSPDFGGPGSLCTGEEDGSLAQEQEGSLCFEDPNPALCITECVDVFDADVCLAQVTLPPSTSPTSAPTGPATESPTLAPSVTATSEPTPQTNPPTPATTLAPTTVAGGESDAPSSVPTGTLAPTSQPTGTPAPSGLESSSPSSSLPPSNQPTITGRPTSSAPPSNFPTATSPPSLVPSEFPTASEPPSIVPTIITMVPTTQFAPSGAPSGSTTPTEMPSIVPSANPTGSPAPTTSAPPSLTPTRTPAPSTVPPSAKPSVPPTLAPTSTVPPSFYPSLLPSEVTVEPTYSPTPKMKEQKCFCKVHSRSGKGGKRKLSEEKECACYDVDDKDNKHINGIWNNRRLNSRQKGSTTSDVRREELLDWKILQRIRKLL